MDLGNLGNPSKRARPEDLDSSQDPRPEGWVGCRAGGTAGVGGRYPRGWSGAPPELGRSLGRTWGRGKWVVGEKDRRAWRGRTEAAQPRSLGGDKKPPRVPMVLRARTFSQRRPFLQPHLPGGRIDSAALLTGHSSKNTAEMGPGESGLATGSGWLESSLGTPAPLPMPS